MPNFQSSEFINGRSYFKSVCYMSQPREHEVQFRVGYEEVIFSLNVGHIRFEGGGWLAEMMLTYGWLCDRCSSFWLGEQEISEMTAQ